MIRRRHIEHDPAKADRRRGGCPRWRLAEIIRWKLAIRRENAAKRANRLLDAKFEDLWRAVERAAAPRSHQPKET